MYQFMFCLFMLTSLFLIVFIMLQEGTSIDKSYDLNSSSIFNIFSNNGNTNQFILKITVFLSIMFFILNIVLSNLSIKHKTNMKHLNKDINHIVHI
ncbi:Protein-export membrane protein SecG [Buchnera aphidicola (Anoecia corni)]|uniref:Protein-export membrane protein SecG n=1 Tax=Buchnera aphidicola (Anoecia corni) TaxID=2994477 RepID=A0AAT9IHE4_9GAMM